MRRLARRAALLVVASALTGAFAHAHEVAYAVGFVDRDAPQDSTHLHGLSDTLTPGECTALTVRLTVLSSANGLDEYGPRIQLLGAEDRRIGTLVHRQGAP